MSANKIIVILGPTSTGKSDLGVFLAKKFNGEIVSADSRQVYRGFDLSSGKMSKKEMEGVPHHMLDVAHPRIRYTAARYLRDATKIVKEIIARKHLPIVVGGTGQYIDALVFRQIFPDVAPNAKLRALYERKSTKELFDLLHKKDPRRAADIDRNNRPRLIRALEIIAAHGNVPPLSKTSSPYIPLFIGLTLPPSDLKKKIEDRIKVRLRKGMLAEVKNLHTQGLSWKRLEELGLEYRYLSRHLQGLITKEEMVDQLAKETLHYAKRQMTWFKRNKDIRWFNPQETKKIEQNVREFLKS